MNKWLPILVLGLTQFVMVLDGTVMNVSITDVVGDLGTTTSNMQLAIATFTLTMAALMLAGAGLGTRLGLRRTFVIGNVIYATGSLTTAFAPSGRFRGCPGGAGHRCPGSCELQRP
jgi:MFS family permease